MRLNPVLIPFIASCAAPDVCEKYESDWECIGVTREQCEEEFALCTEKDLRLVDDAYGCLFDSGAFACDGTTLWSTAESDAIQECGEEIGAFIENLSDECSGLE